MYTLEERINLMNYLNSAFMPVPRPIEASDMIVNVAGFGADDWEAENGVLEGLKRVVMGPVCVNAAKHGFKCSACGCELPQETLEQFDRIKYCPQCGSEVVKAINPDPGKTCGE